MEIQLMLNIYFSVVGISMFCTGVYLSYNCIEGIDNFWDWIIYNLFWIVQPIKALFKFILT